MKKIICSIIALVFVACIITGCGKPAKRVLYNVNMSKYITLGDYKNIPVDKSSDTYKEFYKNVVSSDVESNDFYVEKTTGKVANGDTVNIDYTGKKDGVAFDGGTDTGYELKIGSNSFIEGFETGLIGADVGSTVTLNLKFPETYSQSPDLAGKPVVFTVKINFIKTEEEKKPEDFYKELKFDSLKAYEKDAEKRAINNYLLDAVTANSKIKEYPKADTDLLYTSFKKMTEQNIKSQYNADFSTYLSATNQTEEQFKSKMLKEQVKPAMKQQMALYAIFDKEKLVLGKTAVADEIDKTVKSYNNSNVTAEKLKEYYGEYYFEYKLISDKTLDIIYKSAKIS